MVKKVSASAGDETAANTTASAIFKRQAIEKATEDQPFVLTPHRPNYFLPVTYNSRPNQRPFAGSGETIQNLEFEFQLRHL